MDEETWGDGSDGKHTVEQPYCDDLTCWCHCDVAYHDLVVHPEYSEDDVEQAYAFYEMVRR